MSLDANGSDWQNQGVAIAVRPWIVTYETLGPCGESAVGKIGPLWATDEDAAAEEAGGHINAMDPDAGHALIIGVYAAEPHGPSSGVDNSSRVASAETNPNQRFFSVDQVAERWGVSADLVRDVLRTEAFDLPSRKFGRLIRVSIDDLEAYEHRKKPAYRVQPKR